MCKSLLARSISAAIFASTATMSVQVCAQAQDSGLVMEETVVTGSNIRRRADYDNPAPVQTVGQVEIEHTGAVQIQDIFKGLTVNSGSQIANRQNERQGVSQFSLRGLGLGSTLTLINGRRAGLSPVTDESGVLFTDINQYPVNMIERVEVLTDGASATYGSEAVAGVVNIITRKDFEGVELSVEARDASNSSEQLTFAVGSAFDKGHFSLFGSYYTQDGNFRGDFDWIRNNLVFSSSTGSPGTYAIATTNMDGSISHGLGSSSTRVPDADCEAAGGNISSNRCRYNFINQRRLIAEEDRFQIFSQFNYDISDRVNVFSEVSFSRNEIRDGLGGAVLRTGPLGGNMFIPGSHPFNFWVDDASGSPVYMDPTTYAADWASGSLVATDLAAQFRPLGTKTGDGPNADDIITRFNNARIVSGFDAEINDRWFLNASFTWANSEYTRREPRNYAVDLFQEIINDGLWNPFGTAITNPSLVSPKDGVTTAQNASDVFARFNRVKTDSGRVQQKVAEVIFSGEVGNDIGVAIGAQYRDLDFENYPDGLSGVLEGGRADATFPADGSQDAWAVFAEVAVPFGEDLETQFALRYEDYGDKGGDTIDPKAAFKYNISEALAIRGSWGTSFQAPSIRQVAGSVGNVSVTDPNDSGTAAEGTTYNVTVFTEGSSDLESQSATNYNLGLLLRTEHGLDLSFDYWFYDYKDLILQGASPQTIIDDPAQQSAVIRDASGQLNGVRTGFENRGDAEASGIDLKAAYRPDLDISGELLFDFSVTYILDYTSTEFDGLDGKGDLKGSRNFANSFGSVPDVKANAGVTWMSGNHTVNVSARFIGSYKDDQNGSVAEGFEDIDSQTTIDARYSLLLPELIGSGDTLVHVGVVNITDEDPPLLDNRPGFDTEVHDPRGRQIYLGLKQNF